MKVSGIDYGLLPSWEIEVPDSAIVVENTTPERIPPALEDPAKAVLEAIRNPLGGVKPLADHVTSSSKVTIAINDWLGISVHAVPVVLEELGVAEYGDLVEMNDCVVESDLVIYMSGWSGLPSIWGGYLGGGQGVTVGLGSDRSIMTHHSFRVHEDPASMASDARKQRFMKHKEAVASFVEQTTGKKVFYIEGSINARAEFVQVVAGAGAAIREPIFELADNEKIIDIPEQVDVFISGAAHWGVFYDQVNNPLMSLVQINSRIREYVGDRPPLRQGGVAIFVTPCDGTIDERFRPSDHEMLALFDRLGHDPARLEDYEEEYAHREDLIAKYRFAGGAHPLHPFPVFYENSFILDLTNPKIHGEQAGGSTRRSRVQAVSRCVPVRRQAAG